jgi:hypothetical protein
MLTKTKLVIALATLGLGFATSSFATVTNTDSQHYLVTEGASNLLIQGTQTIARRGRGADDKAGDDRGVHAPGHPLSQDIDVVARRGRGADDKPGDDRGVHAPGHPLSQDVDIVARRGRGADDAPGHIRREDRRADRRQS